MLGAGSAAKAADAMQAEQFRSFLQNEAAMSAERLAKLTRRMTECITTGDMAHVGNLRRVIRRLEEEVRCIDRMAAALTTRFPEESDLGRRA